MENENGKTSQDDRSSQYDTASPSAERNPGSSVEEKGGLSRRQFLVGIGGAGIGVIVGGGFMAMQHPEGSYAIETSDGYLVVDPKKCAGCESCMLACSLVHHGEQNMALARIQIAKDPFVGYPHDYRQNQCRQCIQPSCVEACPVGADHVDPVTHVRTVDEKKCIGCERCIEACPFTPSRIQWNFEEKHAQKCDLCQNTPYWDHEGGPSGTQACVSVCPMKAIKRVNAVPEQTDRGYEVNLRGETWGYLLYPTDDEGLQSPAERDPSLAHMPPPKNMKTISMA